MGDPFENGKVFEGNEDLGRVLTDKFGHPSGSPANYEVLRGKTDEPETISIEEAGVEISSFRKSLGID